MNLEWAKEGVGNWSPAGVDKVVAAYADDAVFHDMPTGHALKGKDNISKMWMGMKDNLDAGEHTFVVTGYTGGPEGGTIEWTWKIKHAADFLGVPAKGKETLVSGASLLIFKNGKIAEQHEYWDMATVLRQLGAIK